MKYTLSYLCFLVATMVQAQYERIPLNNYCSINAIEIDEEYIYPLEASNEAKAILNDILGVVPIAKRTIYLRSSDVDQAIAVVHNNKRYIIYDEFFIEKAKKTTNDKWIVYFVFAHELAHHLNAHGLDSSEFRPGTELEADKFAANILAQLGATKEQTLSASAYFTESDTETHPRQSVRKRQILIGWKNGKQQLDSKNKKKDSKASGKIISRVDLNRREVSYNRRPTNLAPATECEFYRTGDYKIINKTNQDVYIFIAETSDARWITKSLQVKAGQTAYFYKMKAIAFDYKIINRNVPKWRDIKNIDIINSGQILIEQCYEKTMLIEYDE